MSHLSLNIIIHQYHGYIIIITIISTSVESVVSLRCYLRPAVVRTLVSSKILQYSIVIPIVIIAVIQAITSCCKLAGGLRGQTEHFEASEDA